jgi:hypothetical protein
VRRLEIQDPDRPESQIVVLGDTFQHLGERNVVRGAVAEIEETAAAIYLTVRGVGWIAVEKFPVAMDLEVRRFAAGILVESFGKGSPGWDDDDTAPLTRVGVATTRKNDSPPTSMVEVQTQKAINSGGSIVLAGPLKLSNGRLIVTKPFRKRFYPIGGSQASVDVSGSVNRQIGCLRFLLFGWLAVAFKKRKDDRVVTVTVGTPRWTVVEHVPASSERSARMLVARINAEAGVSAEGSGTTEPNPVGYVVLALIGVLFVIAAVGARRGGNSANTAAIFTTSPLSESTVDLSSPDEVSTAQEESLASSEVLCVKSPDLVLNVRSSPSAPAGNVNGGDNIVDVLHNGDCGIEVVDPDPVGGFVRTRHNGIDGWMKRKWLVDRLDLSAESSWTSLGDFVLPNGQPGSFEYQSIRGSEPGQILVNYRIETETRRYFDAWTIDCVNLTASYTRTERYSAAGRYLSSNKAARPAFEPSAEGSPNFPVSEAECPLGE